VGLNQRIASQPDVNSLLIEAWESSAKNAIARGYMPGLIDALMWAGRLDEQQYEAVYNLYVI
jgi:hypothetical protein